MSLRLKNSQCLAMRSHRAQRGFSLIEVVVALAIVAVTLGTVLRLLGTTLVSVDRAGNYLRALGAAQSHLAEASSGSPLSFGVTQGSQDGIEWRLSVQPFSMLPVDPKVTLYHVVVLTSYQGTKVELETLLLAASSLRAEP